MQCQPEWGKRWLAKTGAFLALLFCCVQVGWAQEYVQLRVAFSGAQSHSFVISPGGLYCNSNGGPVCNVKIEKGTKVTLTAIPAKGYYLEEWYGKGCEETSGSSLNIDGDTCTFVMDNDEARTVRFSPSMVGTMYLDIYHANGDYDSFDKKFDVQLSSGVFSCINDGVKYCRTYVPLGATVTLTVKPEFEEKFLAWDGDCTGAEKVCSVIMDKYREIKFLTFSGPPKDMVSLVVKTTGEGVVEGRSDKKVS